MPRASVPLLRGAGEGEEGDGLSQGGPGGGRGCDWDKKLINK